MSRVQRILQNIFHPYSINPLNKEYEAKHRGPDRPVYVFYHIFANNNWREIFDEQISALKKSGLYDVIDELYVSVICQNENELKYISTHIGNKGKIIYSGSDPKAYEFPALLELKKVADEKKCFVMYFHTKGSSNSDETVKWYYPRITSLSKLRVCSRLWRKFMEHFVLTQWETAIAVLYDYDTYGCYLRTQKPYTFYAGNFWWARSEYIKTLKSFTPKELEYRYTAETWLLSGNGNIYDAFRLNPDITGIKFPQDVYNPNSRILAIMGG